MRNRKVVSSKAWNDLLQLLSWQCLVTRGSDRWATYIDYRATIMGNGETTNPNSHPHPRPHAAILLLGNYCKPIELFLCPSHPHQSSMLSNWNTFQFFLVDYYIRIVGELHVETKKNICYVECYYQRFPISLLLEPHSGNEIS